MIRIIFTFLFVFLFLILSIPLMIIEWIIGKFNKGVSERSSLRIVQWAFKVCLFFSGVQLTVIGEENIPKDKAVLYVGNHRSFFDIVITYARVPRPTGYVAKLSMKKIPLLNVWMRLLHCQFLDREHVKEGLKTILKCIELVKNDISICIFPEGTRCKEKDTFLPFHDGSFKVAQKSGCPVIPFAIDNTSAIFEDQFPRIKKRHVILRYGAPVYINELSKEQQKSVGSHFQHLVEEMYNENQQLLISDTK